MLPLKIICRHRKCGRLLMVVESAPVDEPGWSSYVYVLICPEHGENAGSGNVVRWQGRMRALGKRVDRVSVGRWVPWSQLRGSVESNTRDPHRL